MEIQGLLRPELSYLVCATRELAERLDDWMRETGDPLLDGDVPAPPGALINTRDQRSAEEEPLRVPADDPLAAIPS